ncbi:MAG: hypothetical protein QM657_14990 [Lacrimispora sp.]|uniref:hypothetical protein n=1 Tax=Lacrimispora sp. TaxID=2719234 RepID=UPI0039E507DB
MKISNFLSDVADLKVSINMTGSQGEKPMLKSSQGGGSSAPGASGPPKDMSSLRTQISHIRIGCSELIESHTKAEAIIREAAEQMPGNKSMIADMLQSNTEKKAGLEQTVKGLELWIKEYEEKDRTLRAQNISLNKCAAEIKNRNNSANNYVPVYGIIYACDTNKMVQKYKSDLSAQTVLRKWLGENHQQWDDRKTQLPEVKIQIEELKRINDKLQEEGGKVCELLTILSTLTVELNNFLIGISSVEHDLELTFLKTAAEAQVLIDTALTKVSAFSDVLQKKLDEYSSELPEKTINEVKLLVS